jgi:putative FmdB family regulatory protein
MPIYEYFCPGCGKTFELMRPFSQSDAPASCPVCRTKGEKLLSAFASKSEYSIKTPAKEPVRYLPAGTGSPSKVQRKSRKRQPVRSGKEAARSPRAKRRPN